MAAKKAKSSPKAVRPAKAAAQSNKSKSKVAAPKTSAIGSLKSMLGLTKKKEAPKPVGKAGAKASIQAPALAGKKGLQAKAGKAAEPKDATPPVKSGKPGRPPKNAQKGGEKLSYSRNAAPVSGPPVCREVACELLMTTGGYCRMHYIKNWKKIKRKLMILQERKLNSYIEELVSKYPDKYIEAIRQDLASEKDFAKVISDLEIEESMDDFESVETETAEGIIDNLKRDFDDDGDVF